MMKKSKEKSRQPSLIEGEPDKVTRSRNRPYGSSYQSRCFQQLKSLADLRAEWLRANREHLEQYLDALDLELQKAEMLVKEREEVLRRKREEYAKRGTKNVSDS